MDWVIRANGVSIADMDAVIDRWRREGATVKAFGSDVLTLTTSLGRYAGLFEASGG